MGVEIDLRCGGDIEGNEHKCALRLKEMFEEVFSKKYKYINGWILIYSNAQIVGQRDVNEIDIVCAGEFEKHLKLEGLWTKAKKLTNKNITSENFKEENVNHNAELDQDDEYKYRDVYVKDFVFCLEVKNHDISGIKLDGLNLKVKYHDRNSLHDATDQSFKQKYALMNFLRSGKKSESGLWIYNFIWLNQVNREGLDELLGTDGNYEKRKNILPREFQIRYIFNLACLQGIPAYMENNPGFLFLNSSRGKGGIEQSNLIERFKQFTQMREGMGNLTRKKIDKMTKTLLKDQKYAKAIGNKLLIINGRAGTGKTFKLVSIAYDLAFQQNKRCLILTYNKALVSDIKRLLRFKTVGDSSSSAKVEISTLHKYIYDLIIAFELAEKKKVEDDSLNSGKRDFKGEEKKDLDNFLKYYDDFLEDIFEHVNIGAIKRDDVKDLVKSKEQSVLWDYLLIDECQDWQARERDILYKLFDYKSIILADGIDQMVRRTKRCDWKTNLLEIESTTERRCFRQKNNLANFMNAYAEEFSLDWSVEPINENLGGSIYISEIENDFELFKKQKEKGLSEGHANYDFMFLTPPSLVDKIGGFIQKEEYEKNGFKLWDGTNKDLRSDYPDDLELHRLLQYESCRGLEAWCVVCLALDDFIKHKIEIFKDEDLEQTFDFIQDKEDKKFQHSHLWSLIPLTRPIDTLIITLKDSEADYVKKLKTIVNEYRDFVYWIN